MKSTQFNPIEDYILVKPIALETGEAHSAGGIVTALEQNNSIINRPTEGIVVACGKQTKELTQSMHVMWLETDGQDIELDDGVFLVLKEKSILGFKNV